MIELLSEEDKRVYINKGQFGLPGLGKYELIGHWAEAEDADVVSEPEEVHTNPREQWVKGQEGNQSTPGKKDGEGYRRGPPTSQNGKGKSGKPFKPKTITGGQFRTPERLTLEERSTTETDSLSDMQLTASSGTAEMELDDGLYGSTLDISVSGNKAMEFMLAKVNEAQEIAKAARADAEQLRREMERMATTTAEGLQEVLDRTTVITDSLRQDLNGLTVGIAQLAKGQEQQTKYQRYHSLMEAIERDFSKLSDMQEKLEEAGGQPAAPTDTNYEKRHALTVNYVKKVLSYKKKMHEFQVVALALGEDVKTFNEDHYVDTPA